MENLEQNKDADLMVFKIKIPTPGRIVHFFTGGRDSITQRKLLPAMVVAAFNDGALVLSVFTENGNDPVETRSGVIHRSEAYHNEMGEPEGPYWDWPERVS